MSIIILFVNAGVLFECALCLWVSLRRDVFLSAINYLYGKLYFGYAGIPLEQADSPWSRPAGMGCNTSLLHRNVTADLWRNDCSLLILFIIPFRVLYKQPLSIFLVKSPSPHLTRIPNLIYWLLTISILIVWFWWAYFATVLPTAIS